jgi:MoxR-like ATPase
VLARKQVLSLIDQMGKAIVGQERVVERLVLGLLANGNLLVEGLPGLAKTRAIKALASNLEADFSRIQFTPDLFFNDTATTEIYTQASGEFRFEPGPLFANIVLGDEINRAPAKVQAALLEAMEERQVTVAGTTHSLPPLYMVMATQNPVEHEGTYPLPEAQMDRFLMHVKIDYPSVEDEVAVVELVRAEEFGQSSQAAASAAAESRERNERIPQSVIFSAREEIGRLAVSPALVRYIADVVYATRTPEKYHEDLDRWIDVGASPRGSLALDKGARVHAWLNDRDYVDPEDVRAVVHDVLRHRLMLSYEAQGEGVRPDQVLDRIIELVALP